MGRDGKRHIRDTVLWGFSFLCFFLSCSVDYCVELRRDYIYCFHANKQQSLMLLDKGPRFLCGLRPFLFLYTVLVFPLGFPL